MSGKQRLVLHPACASGDVPAEMAKMRVRSDLMNVVAGTRFRGDFGDA